MLRAFIPEPGRGTCDCAEAGMRLVEVSPRFAEAARPPSRKLARQSCSAACAVMCAVSAWDVDRPRATPGDHHPPAASCGLLLLAGQHEQH